MLLGDKLAVAGVGVNLVTLAFQPLGWAIPIPVAISFLVGGTGLMIFGVLVNRLEATATDPPLPVVTFDGNNLRSPVYIENIGGHAARNVSLRPISLEKVKYTFKSVPVLRPGDRVRLALDTARSELGPFDARQLWRLYGYGDEVWLSLAVDRATDTTVPFVMEFRDALFRPRLERQTVTVHPDGSLDVRSKSPSLDKPMRRT